MNGPVTRVYWRHYSKYYDRHDTLGEAAYAVKYGDGNGLCCTVKVIDEDGETVFVNGETHSNPFIWEREVLGDDL